MKLSWQPISIDTGSPDEDGLLVLAEGRLVAVLVRLSDDHEGTYEGAWFLEVGFGKVDGNAHPVFATLDDAEAWIESRLTSPVLTGASPR